MTCRPSKGRVPSGLGVLAGFDFEVILGRGVFLFVGEDEHFVDEAGVVLVVAVVGGEAGLEDGPVDVPVGVFGFFGGVAELGHRR